MNRLPKAPAKPKHNATPAALRKAEEAGLDIDEVDGTGAEGRVTVHDVEKAAAG